MAIPSELLKRLETYRDRRKWLRQASASQRRIFLIRWHFKGPFAYKWTKIASLSTPRPGIFYWKQNNTKVYIFQNISLIVYSKQNNFSIWTYQFLKSFKVMTICIEQSNFLDKLYNLYSKFKYNNKLLFSNRAFENFGENRYEFWNCIRYT